MSNRDLEREKEIRQQWDEMNLPEWPRNSFSDNLRKSAKGDKIATIADLMAMGNDVFIKPDGSVEQKEPSELTKEPADALVALTTKQFPVNY